MMNSRWMRHLATTLAAIGIMWAALTACASDPAPPSLPSSTTEHPTTSPPASQAGADEPLPGAFVLSVTGTGTAQSIAWGAGSGVQFARNATLPWSVSIPADPTKTVMSLLLQVDLAPDSTDTVTCTISRDGEQLATSTEAGGALCQATART